MNFVFLLRLCLIHLEAYALPRLGKMPLVPLKLFLTHHQYQHLKLLGIRLDYAYQAITMAI